MLVLNTNREQEREFSNQMLIGGYLDFNQILLKPYIFHNNSTYINFSGEGNNSPNSRSYFEKEVNGTKINIARSCIFDKRRLFDKQRGNSGYINFSSRNPVNSYQTQMLSNTNTVRMGVEGQLMGGELIGRKMMGSVYYVPIGGVSNSNAQYKNLVIKFRYVLALLGTNGVIRKIGETKWFEYTHNQGYTVERKNIYDFFESNFTPVEANPGDIVIVDIELATSANIINNTSYNISANFGVEIYFGSNSALEYAYMTRPIQISIE